MSEDLATLWPDKPQALGPEIFNKASQPKMQATRGFCKMEFSKFELLKTGLAVVGGVTVVYAGLAVFAPKYLGDNALKGMEPTEQAFLGQVERYCFNRLPMLNDNQTCRMWAGKYVQLVSGVDPKLDLFGAEVKQQLADGFEAQGITTKDRQKMEAEAEAATMPGKR